ncbi:hypothetical protein MTR_2g084560 [Medicago truncatula]|uniref:Uncharacterized protein n=1 Tax=Medicago truncatula TaxID=3880 RepID=A0A072VLB1_MEDTR|nr:hypothetical protein MTR_2g084560 [Medicago truncatula]
MDNQENRNETSTLINTNNQSSCGAKARLEASACTSSYGPANKQQKPKSVESTQAPTSNPSDSLVPPVSSYGTATLKSSNSLKDLTKPLLENDKQGAREKTVGWEK